MGDGQQRQQKTMQNQQVSFDKRVPTKEVQNDVFMNLALSICNLRLSPAKRGPIMHNSWVLVLNREIDCT
jgi:hypothetical protein